jgi:EmrB/QacA subfamily drug resistance transporter
VTPERTEPAPLFYATARGRWVIAATVLGSGIATLDSTVVGIALPAIHHSFESGVGTLQWVVTGYLLTLSGLLLPAGALGDRYGRRRMFMIGTVWFAVASALCGIAPGAGLLIAARVLQGVGGALLTPASLAILEASFTPDDRARAIGAWSGLGGLAAAAGPLVGGYLIAVASWRWVFFINLPVAAAVLLIAGRHVPESADPTATGGIDLPGAALAMLFLSTLSYACIEGPTAGWGSAVVVGCFTIAVLSAPAFLLVERRRRNPMLPLGLFRSRQFSAANAVTFIVYGALGGALFLLPVVLQVVDGYSPLQAGLSLLPVTFIMLAFSARSGKLATRIGPRLQMSVGPVVVGVGLAMLSLAGHGGSYITDVLPAVVVFGAGLAITVAPLTATALGAVTADHAGVASAVNNVVARAAGLLTVAVLPVVAGISGAAALVPSSLAAGFDTAVRIAGAACVLGGLLAALTIRNPPGAERLLRRAPVRQWHCALDASPLEPHSACARTHGSS